MFCAISGVVPEQPVVSSKSGYVFDKILITKYIKEMGKCPVTNEPLSEEDLLPLKTNKAVKARPATATSIPGLLSIFHDEWDALMLECHQLRSSLLTTRQELSHCLYQHDAATRVIARLIKERDEARAALEDALKHASSVTSAAAASAPASTAPAAIPTQLPEDTIADLLAVNKTLTGSRKKRAISESLASTSDLAAATLQTSEPLHSAANGGILDIQLHPTAPAVAATAGADSKIHLFDFSQERLRGSLEGHSKRVTSLSFVGSSGDVLLSASADHTVRVWRGRLNSDPSDASSPADYSNVSVVNDPHGCEVVSVVAHPSKRHFVSMGANSSWSFFDLENLACLNKANGGGEICSAASLHPDGMILALATAAGPVRIWEVRQASRVASCDGHEGPVKGVSFSENGYHFATASEDGTTRLWDLRKIKCFKTLNPFGGANCTAASFDASGQYLAVGGPTVKVFAQKQEWDEIVSLSPVAKKANALRWGADSRILLAGAADHNLRIFAAAAAEDTANKKAASEGSDE
uniref:Pre-mRNA-processing factor 19 n=2 Tax=Polytomella parva TaxID=51329 RepID=A0A7S0YHM9_9CHLO|mmetsp:Transcript_2051/g.3054  ORF Transcript_2051/g.3054 Transcript_2051/m.3054 type:complete len:525 (+) Transcript_2051:111-1685(+)